MELTEIARQMRGNAANLALRMPISWVHILAGLPRTMDGRTLDGRTQWLLELLARTGQQQPLETLPLAVARAEFDAFQLQLSGSPATVGSIVDRTIDGPGGRLRIRIYRPVASGPQPLPAILYFHGGGWVIGSLESYDPPCRFFCARTGCAVIAVDYRLAPENRFPAATDDALASFRWLASKAGEVGIDSSRIVVAGDSAGGTLAAVVAQAMRHEPVQPCLQWLIYPCTDMSGDTASHRAFAEGFLLTRRDMEWCRGLYLGEADAADPRASPLRQGDLGGLPPALVFTSGFDPLRDEGKAYADRMSEAGVRTVYREFDSLIHGFIGMRGAVQAAARAMDDMVAGVRHELARMGF